MQRVIKGRKKLRFPSSINMARCGQVLPNLYQVLRVVSKLRDSLMGLAILKIALNEILGHFNLSKNMVYTDKLNWGCYRTNGNL